MSEEDGGERAVGPDELSMTFTASVCGLKGSVLARDGSGHDLTILPDGTGLPTGSRIDIYVPGHRKSPGGDAFVKALRLGSTLRVTLSAADRRDDGPTFRVPAGAADAPAPRWGHLQLAGHNDLGFVCMKGAGSLVEVEVYDRRVDGNRRLLVGRNSIYLFEEVSDSDRAELIAAVEAARANRRHRRAAREAAREAEAAARAGTMLVVTVTPLNATGRADIRLEVVGDDASLAAAVEADGSVDLSPHYRPEAGVYVEVGAVADALRCPGHRPGRGRHGWSMYDIVHAGRVGAGVVIAGTASHTDDAGRPHPVALTNFAALGFARIVTRGPAPDGCVVPAPALGSALDDATKPQWLYSPAADNNEDNDDIPF